MVIIRVTEHLHSKMFEFCGRVAESRHRSSLLMIVAMLLTSPAPAHAAATQGAPIVEFQFGNPLGLGNSTYYWNADISGAPVASTSSTLISVIGSAAQLHADFGGDAGGGDIYGFPYIQVDSAVPYQTVTFTLYGSQSDGVSTPYYPIPSEAISTNGWVEGGAAGNVDKRGVHSRHLLIFATDADAIYELYNVFYNSGAARWEAASGAGFDFFSPRPDGWRSGDSSGLAILPGLVRYDEVFGDSLHGPADEIRHAFRVTLPQYSGHVYPASADPGAATATAGALPLGARLRLKAGKD